MNVRRITISLLLAFSTSAFGQEPANSWHGLRPLKSTRQDVETTFGKPIKVWFRGQADFQTDKGKASIYFSTKKCDGGWNVQENTIITIEAGEGRTKTSEDLGLGKGDQFLWSTDAPSHNSWIDPVRGLKYNFGPGVHDDRMDYVLESITYGPTRADNVLRCNGFAPYAPGRHYFTMRSWRFLDPEIKPREALRKNVAQIDNAMIELDATEGKNIGYAVVYFDNKRSIAFYEKQLKELKKNFSRRWKRSKSRLVYIEGGLREESELVLYIIPKGFLSPVPEPSLPSPQFMR